MLGLFELIKSVIDKEEFAKVLSTRPAETQTPIADDFDLGKLLKEYSDEIRSNHS